MEIAVNLNHKINLCVHLCTGGVISECLFLAIHEISHNLAFGHNNLMANRLFGMFANLPLGFPLSVTFKK